MRPVEALDALVDAFQPFGVLIDRRALAETLISGLGAGHVDAGSASTLRVVLCLIAGSDELDPL